MTKPIFLVALKPKGIDSALETCYRLFKVMEAGKTAGLTNDHIAFKFLEYAPRVKNHLGK